MLYLSDTEAAELYQLWHERVAQAVRRAHAKANGRRDTHDADLAALRQDLTAVNLHTVDTPEPDAAPGTALEAAQAGRRFLNYAEEDHARAEHLAAILWLQAAYLGAKVSAELDRRSRLTPGKPDSAQRDTPSKAWWQQFGIPRQRDGQ